FRLAERRPSLAHAMMASLICWSFSNSMCRYLLATTLGRPGSRVLVPVRVAFRLRNGVGAQGMNLYEALAGLCAPLPTLRRRPYGLQRTARGRCESLLPHRIGLAPTARCRSPGALRKILDITNSTMGEARSTPVTGLDRAIGGKYVAKDQRYWAIQLS